MNQNSSAENEDVPLVADTQPKQKPKLLDFSNPGVRLLIAMIAISFIGFVLVGYFTSKKAEPEQMPQISSPSLGEDVSPLGGKNLAEQNYGKSMQVFNEEQTALAAQRGGTFLPLPEQPFAKATDPVNASCPTCPTCQTCPPPAPLVVPENMSKVMDELFNRAANAGSIVTLSPKKGEETRQAAAPIQNAGLTLQPSDNFRGIRSGDTLYGTLEFGINSDIPGPIQAVVQGGALNGAKLIGGFQRVGEYVVARFDRVIPRDAPEFNAKIWAVQPDLQLPAMQGEVDNHFFQRYVLLSAAAALRGAGAAVAATGNKAQILTNGTTILSNEQSVTEKAVAGMAAAVGGDLSSVMQRAAQRPPTVKVEAGEGIGLWVESIKSTTPQGPIAQTQEQDPIQFNQNNTGMMNQNIQGVMPSRPSIVIPFGNASQ